MFSSNIPDVAAGVIFAFLAVSLITSALVEAINSVLKLRSRSLLTGIKQLVNDPQFTKLAKQLYQHASMNPRGDVDTPKNNLPAYVDSKQFANALLDVTKLSDAAAAALKTGSSQWVALEAQINAIQDEQIRTALTGMLTRAKGDLDDLNREVCLWFDTAMDRVSGAFKRWTQLASFAIALTIAVLLNVDGLHVAQSMWDQSAIAERLKVPAAFEGSGPAAAEAAVAFLNEHLPVGWPSGTPLRSACPVIGGAPRECWFWEAPGMLRTILGWLLTAFSALFGAPFWFDALQNVTRLKGAGPSPKEKADGKAAAA